MITAAEAKDEEKEGEQLGRGRKVIEENEVN